MIYSQRYTRIHRGYTNKCNDSAGYTRYTRYTQILSLYGTEKHVQADRPKTCSFYVPYKREIGVSGVSVYPVFVSTENAYRNSLFSGYTAVTRDTRGVFLDLTASAYRVIA